MGHIVSSTINYLVTIMADYGLISGLILVIFESIIPILPLAVFIALNVITYGSMIGFIVSWIGTIIGCMIMFLLCRKFKNKFLKKFDNNEKVKKVTKKISNISYSSLVLILSIPFTPAFAINIGAAFSNIEPKKYLSALIIGKIPMIYFWGFIGKNLFESITDIYTIMQIVAMLLAAYFVSKIASKYLDL